MVKLVATVKEVLIKPLKQRKLVSVSNPRKEVIQTWEGVRPGAVKPIFTSCDLMFAHITAKALA